MNKQLVVMVGLFSVVSVQLAGCGSESKCIQGMSVACTCTNGATGAQVCNAQGTLDACVCSGAGGGTATGGGSAMGGGNATGGGSAVDAGMDAGVVDAGPPVFIALVPNVPAPWGNHNQAMGAFGLAAGTNICRANGADHPCEYQEVLRARARGEFVNIDAGTTAWLQRGTPAITDAGTLDAGPGANCNNWTFVGGHIANGERVEFQDAGAMVFLFDRDPFYDGMTGPHVQVGLDCNLNRGLLCCN